DSQLVLAALRNHLMEEVELREDSVEPQLEENESALGVHRRGLRTLGMQPAQEVLNPLLQLASSVGEKTFDRDLGRGQKTRGREHGLREHKWLHAREPCQ